MRTLILLRHAKSSWALPGVEDHERDLNERGVKSGPVIARWLEKREERPGQILCSTATRTRRTLALMRDAVDFMEAVTFSDELYLASANRILRLVSGFDDDLSTGMIIAHNPGLHEAALNFLTSDERSASGDLRISFPTCGIAIVSLPINTWKEASWDIGSLNAYMVPRQLMD